MNDALFYILDALLGAARGTLISSKAKSIQEEYGLNQDPRGKLTQLATNPLGSAAINLVSSYFLTRQMRSDAQDLFSSSKSTRNIKKPNY